MLADRDGTGVLLERDGRNGIATGRQVEVGPLGELFPFLVPSRVRPSLTLAAGSLWTVVSGDVVRVDPVSATVALRLPLRSPGSITAGPSGLWVIGPDIPTGVFGFVTRHVLRLDPASGAVVEDLAYGPREVRPVEVAVGSGGLWVSRASGPARGLVRLSATGLVAEPAFGSWQLFARAGTLYSTERHSCDVTVVPWSGPARFLRMCRGSAPYPRDVAAAGGAVWWAGHRGGGLPGVVYRRALASGGASTLYRVGRDPVDVVPSGRGVWVLSRSDRTITRLSAP